MGQEHLGNIVREFGTGNGTAAIVSLMEQGLYERERREQERRKAEGKSGPRLYVTDVGRCPAATWNRLCEIPETQPLGIDALVNFLIGHETEDVFADILRETHSEIQVKREIPIQLPIRGGLVSGRADFLIADEVLIELKSISSRNMGWVLRREEGGRPEHRSQVNLYMHASQHNGFGTRVPAIEQAKLIYIVKDPTKGEPVFHGFDVRYGSVQAEQDLWFLTLIWRAFVNGERPVCDCKTRFNGKGPLYCNYGPVFPCCERED